MKRTLYFIMCIVTLVTLKGVAQVIDADRERTYERIDRAVSNQDWAMADSLIVEAIHHDPADPNNILLLGNLGMIRFYAGQDSLALETLSRAVEMAPSSVALLGNRARVYAATGQPAKAIADYNSITALDSAYTDAYLNRGMIYLYGGYFEGAEEEFARLQQLAPNAVSTHVALASLYTITSRPRLALDHFSVLIAAEPSAEYYAGRAMCLLEIDNLNDASEDISSGLELDPDYSELYLARAILNKKRFETAASRRDARQAIELGADPRRVNLILGQDK